MPESIVLDGVHCSMTIEQPTANILILRLSGIDIGEFGDAPMLALDDKIAEPGPVRLFIDARNVVSASIEVSGEWAQWLRKNKSRLAGIDMLTGSQFIEVTADFVRRFADLEGVMRVYTHPSAFDDAISAAIGG